MHCEDLLINYCGNGQAVKAVRECLPQLDVISPLTLVVEAVDTIDRSTLVIAPQDKEIFRVFDLVGKEQADGLQRLLASINIVS